MALNIDENAIKSAIKALTPDKRRGWFVFCVCRVIAGYNGNNVVLQKTGSGDTTEMVSNLSDDQVQYAYIRLPDKKAGVDTIRDVFVCWCGPNVKKIEAARKKTNTEQIRKVFQPHAAEVEALNRASFDEATLLDRSSPLSGSHVID